MIQLMTTIAILATVGAFLALQTVTLRRWTGRWRWLAAVPLFALALLILNIVVGVLRDPTAHNLWPLELAMYIGGGLVYLALLFLIRKFFKG